MGDYTTTEVQHKWKQLGDLALSSCNLQLAQDCAKYSDDLAGQLVIFSSLGQSENIASLGDEARQKGRFNVAFLCYFLLGKIDTCLDILNQAGRVPEAAFLARTYMPSKVSEMVSLWRTDLERVSKRAAESLADPTNYANMFPDLALALQAESLITQRRQKGLLPAAAYPKARVELDLNLIDEMRKLAERTSAVVAEPDPESDEAEEEAAAAAATASACAAPEVESASPEAPADNTSAEGADA